VNLCLARTLSACLAVVLLSGALVACGGAPATTIEAEPLGRGPYAVGSTNMAVSPAHAAVGDDAMHAYLLGRPTESGEARFVTDILEHPEAAWVTDVRVPDEQDIYGRASGLTLPVVSFVTYPSRAEPEPARYVFPYHDGRYGVFEHMLGPAERPAFAEPHNRYPLILLAHGAPAHGIYDVARAHDLASHGYIVAAITYGDDRTAIPNDPNQHLSYLRPLITKAVLDSLLESEVFGPHIDADNIGITGHSFGGFTALAITGGAIEGNAASVTDDRIKASVIAAPWVGGRFGEDDVFAFGESNSALGAVDTPTLCFFGTSDDVTLASFILPAAKKLSGPTYVVELVDQPHVFEAGSWEDRNGWELLFFSAYLKQDLASQRTLRTATSMKGGNEDRQLFEYQQAAHGD
jgi:predicted dienelactone hydrolase